MASPTPKTNADSPSPAATMTDAAGPVTSEPVVGEPVVQDPAGTGPVASEPVASEPVAASPPRSLWSHGAFVQLWGGQSLSLVGTQVTIVAMPLVALQLLNASATQMGVLGGLAR